MSGREVRDLQAVWEDGSIVCDIINAVMVGNCEPKDHHGNCLRHAQELASHHFKLLPAFSNSELQKPFNSSLEKRLWRYLLSLRNALKLRLANNMTDQDEKDPEYLIAEEYVARGMGLISASKGERAIFFIYSRDDSSLADIHIHIKGPNGDCGEATAGEPIDSENHSIAIDYRLTPDYLKVCYSPKSLGRHELSLTRYGFSIPGSPFIIKVGEHTGPPAEKFSYLQWLTEEQEEEHRLEIERKRNLKIVSRVIDFITEKMHMTNDGNLVKIDELSLRVPSPAPCNLKRTGRSLSPRPKCKLSSQKRSKSLTNQKLIQAAEFLKFSTSKEETKCVQDAASQVSEDFSMIHPVGIDQFQEKCQRIVRACDFLLSHAPKQKSLEILSTAEKILDVPYNNTLTHHKSSLELYRPDIGICTPDITTQNLTTESSRSSETDDEKEIIKLCTPEIDVTRVDFSDRLYSMRKFDDVGLNAVSSFNSGSPSNENISAPHSNREKDRRESTPQKDARMARKSFQTVGYTKAKRSSQTSLPTNNISDEMGLSDDENDNVEGNKEIQNDSVGEDKNLSNVQVVETSDHTETNAQEEMNFEHSSTRLSRSREPKITRNSKQAKKENLVEQFVYQSVCSIASSVGIELILLPGVVETNGDGGNVENSMKTSVDDNELIKNNCEVVGKSLEAEINDVQEMRSNEIGNESIQNSDETNENVSETEIFDPEQGKKSDETNGFNQKTCDGVNENMKKSTGDDKLITGNEIDQNNREINVIVSEGDGKEDRNTHDKIDDPTQDIGKQSEITENSISNSTLQGNENKHEVLQENTDTSQIAVEIGFEEDNTVKKKSLEGSFLKEEIQVVSSIKSRISAFEDYSRKIVTDSVLDKNSKKGGSVGRFRKRVTSTGDGKVEDDNDRESIAKMNPCLIENNVPSSEVPVVRNTYDKTVEEDMKSENKDQLDNVEELSNSNLAIEVEDIDENAKGDVEIEGEKHFDIIKEIPNSNVNRQFEDSAQCLECNYAESEFKSGNEVILENSVEYPIKESSATVDVSNEDCVLLSVKHLSFDDEPSPMDVEEPVVEDVKNAEIDETTLSNEETQTRENEITIPREDENLITEELVENTELNHSENLLKSVSAFAQDNVVDRNDILSNTNQDDEDTCFASGLPSSSKDHCTVEKELLVIIEVDRNSNSNDDLHLVTGEDAKSDISMNDDNSLLAEKITVAPDLSNIEPVDGGEAKDATDSTQPENKTEIDENRGNEVLETGAIDGDGDNVLEENREDFVVDVKKQTMIINEKIDVSISTTTILDQENNLSPVESDVTDALSKNKFYHGDPIPENELQENVIEDKSNNEMKKDKIVTLSESIMKIEAPLECNSSIISDNSACNTNLITDEKGIGVDEHGTSNNNEVDSASDNEHKAIDGENDVIMNETNSIVVNHDELDSQNIEMYKNINETNIDMDHDVILNNDLSEDVDHTLVQKPDPIPGPIETVDFEQDIISSESVVSTNELENEQIIHNDSKKQNFEDSVIIQNKVYAYLEFDGTDKDMIFSEEKSYSNVDDHEVENLENEEKSSDCLVEDIEGSVEMSPIDGQNTCEMTVNSIRETEEEKFETNISGESKINSSNEIEKTVLIDSSELIVSDHLLDKTCEIKANLDRIEPKIEQNVAQSLAEDHILEDNKRSINPVRIDELDNNECSIEGYVASDNVVSVEKTQDNTSSLLDSVTSRMGVENIETNIEQVSEIILNVSHDVISNSAEVEKVDLIVTISEDCLKNDTEDNKLVDQELEFSDDQKLFEEVDYNHEEIILADHNRDESESDALDLQESEAVIDEANIGTTKVEKNFISINEVQSISESIILGASTQNGVESSGDLKHFNETVIEVTAGENVVENIVTVIQSSETSNSDKETSEDALDEQKEISFEAENESGTKTTEISVVNEKVEESRLNYEESNKLDQLKYDRMEDKFEEGKIGEEDNKCKEGKFESEDVRKEKINVFGVTEIIDRDLTNENCEYMEIESVDTENASIIVVDTIEKSFSNASDIDRKEILSNNHSQHLEVDSVINSCEDSTNIESCATDNDGLSVISGFNDNSYLELDHNPECIVPSTEAANFDLKESMAYSSGVDIISDISKKTVTEDHVPQTFEFDTDNIETKDEIIVNPDLSSSQMIIETENNVTTEVINEAECSSEDKASNDVEGESHIVGNEIEIDQHLENNGEELTKKEVEECAGKIEDEKYIHENNKMFEPVVDVNRICCLKEESDELLIKAGSESEIVDTGITGKEPENSLLVKDDKIVKAMEKIVEDATETIEKKEMTQMNEENISANVIGVTETFENYRGDNNMEDINCQNNLDELVETLCNISARIRVEQELQDNVINEEDVDNNEFEVEPVDKIITEVNCEEIETEQCLQQNKIEKKVEIRDDESFMVSDDASFKIDTTKDSSILEEDSGNSEYKSKIIDSAKDEHENLIENLCQIQINEDKSQIVTGIIDISTEKELHENFKDGIEPSQLDEVNLSLNEITIEQKQLLEKTVEDDIGSTLGTPRDEKSMQEIIIVNVCENTEVEMEYNINLDNSDSIINSHLQKTLTIDNDEILVETDKGDVTELVSEIEDFTESVEMIAKALLVGNCSEDNDKNFIINSNNSDSEQSIQIVKVNVEDENDRSDKSSQLIDMNGKIEKNYVKTKNFLEENIEDTSTKSEEEKMEEILGTISSETQPLSLEDVKIVHPSSCDKLGVTLEVDTISFEGHVEIVDQKQINMNEICINKTTADNFEEIDQKQISREDNLEKDFSAEELKSEIQTNNDLIKTEPSSSELLLELNSELENEQSQVLSDSEPEKLMETIGVSMDLSEGTPDSIFKNNQEETLDITGDSEHVTSNFDTANQSNVANEGVAISSITISNEHGLSSEVNISKNIFQEEVGMETSRDNEKGNLKCELSSNNNNNFKDFSNEEFINDLIISIPDEKIDNYNDKKGELNEIECCNQPLLSIHVENTFNDSQSVTQDKSMNEKCEVKSEVKLEELKSVEDEIVSDELISSVKNYDLIESCQPNEGPFEKELVYDVDLSLDEVSTNHNDNKIIDLNKIECDGNEFFDEVLEESKTNHVTSETIESKLVGQLSPSEETIVESITSEETPVYDPIKIEQTASAGIETLLSISKDENSTDLKNFSEESDVLDENMQNEDSQDIFCNNILENNKIMNSDGVISNKKDTVDLGTIDGDDAVISKEEMQEHTSFCKVQVPVIDFMSVDSPITKDSDGLTENFKPENISDQQNHCSENYSNNIMVSDVPGNESTATLEIKLIENNESFKEDKCDINKNDILKIRELNTKTAEEEEKMVESDKQVEEELKSEDRMIAEKDVSLEMIDVNDDSIQVNTEPAASETTVDSSSEVECIRNESPSTFHLSELSLSRQEMFVLVKSSKNVSPSGEKNKNSGVKSLIEKFSNNITTTAKESESILEPYIVKCDPLGEIEKLESFYEVGENLPDQNNKLSKLVQRFESNIVDEGQHDVLKTNDEMEVVIPANVDIYEDNEIIGNKVDEGKEIINDTISKEIPTNITTILTDVVYNEKNDEDETFPSQHEFDLCSIESHDDDVVSKSYTDINDEDNDSLTKNENFGSTEHLLLCVENIEDLVDGCIKPSVTDEGENNTSESMNNVKKCDEIICENEEALRLTHENHSSIVEFTESKNQKMYHNVCGIDSMDVETSVEVMKRYGTSNDLLEDLIIEENLAKNETEVEEKSLVSFIEIDESMNLNREEIVSGVSLHPLITEENIIEVGKSELKSYCDSENIGEISSQNSCGTQDGLLITEEQPDSSQDKVKSQNTGMEIPTEVTLFTPPPSHESHHTGNESALNEADENPAENSETRDVCYEILNEISKTEEDSLLKTSISDNQGTDSTGSELNRSISLIVNSSLESDYNFCNSLQDDGAQISECVLEVLMSNNENLESVEEPERDSLEDILSTEAGEACVELDAKKVTEELAWLNKQSNELEEPASLSSFNLWPSDTDFGPSNEPNLTAELSEDIDFDSIISAPSLDEALKKFEKRLSDKMSKETIYNIEQSNESKILEVEKVMNKTAHDKIIMENQDKTCVDFEKSQDESNMNSDIDLLLKNKENCEGFNKQDIITLVDDVLVDTENSQIEPNSNSENGLLLDNIGGSITPIIETQDYKKSIVTVDLQKDSNLNNSIDQLLKNYDSVSPTIESPICEGSISQNDQNEANINYENDFLLENEGNNDDYITSNTEISVDGEFINTENSQKGNDIDLMADDKELIDSKISQNDTNMHIGIYSFLGNNESSVTPIEESSDHNELINTKSSQIESILMCDIDPLLVNVENDGDLTKSDTKSSNNNELMNNDSFQIKSNLKCEVNPLLEKTENNEGSIKTNINTPVDKNSTNISNFLDDSNFDSDSDLLKGNIKNNESSIIITNEEILDNDNKSKKEEVDLFSNNYVFSDKDLVSVSQTNDAEIPAHTNSLLESLTASNNVHEVNNHIMFQIDENLQDRPESLIKYCVPCADRTSDPPLSNNHCSTPSSRMEIIREETEEISDNQEVEEIKQMREEGLTPFLDSDDASVSDISECLEKFDSLIQETELRDRDLLDIDENRLIQISVTDCDSEEHSDNLLTVESEVPECDRMMNELVNFSDLELEHQLGHFSQVNENDNLDTGSRNENVAEVHEISHHNDTPHHISTALNLKDGSTVDDSENNSRDDKKVSSNDIFGKKLGSTGVTDDGCKKTERKPRKSLVKSKKMFWDEKLKNLQAEQENKSKTLIEKRTRTVSKDNSNRIVVVQPTSKINKGKQCNKKKLTDATNENLVNLETTIEKSGKQTHSNEDTTSNRNLIVEEPIKIVVDLSDEILEDRKSVDNWKNYWNNLLVNEKDEDPQIMRRQPSIKVQGIVATSRTLFEKPNSNLERSVSCEMLTDKSDMRDKRRIPARSVGENLNKMGLETPYKCQEGHKSRADEKSSEILQKSESISNISERIKFFERSSIASNTEAKGNNINEMTMNSKNKKKSSVENTSTPCSPTTIKIDYFDHDQETLSHQILKNKRMKSKSIDSSDGDMYDPLTMTLSGRVRSFSTGKIEETPDGSLSNIEEDRSVNGSDQCLKKSYEDLKKTCVLETTALSRAKSEGNLSMNEEITSRARFEQAKSFFKCLEKENLDGKKVRDDCLILQKPGRLKQISMDSDSCGEGCKLKKKESKYRRRGRRRRKDSSMMKIRSAPTSDTECRMSMYDSEFGGSERHKSKRIADRFHVKHLFRDISGDTDGIFKGIPNGKAVLASLEDLRADSVPDEQQDHDEPTRSQSLSSIPSGYQDEYPYLPTTPPSQYRHRSQLEDRLISRCKLVTYEMEI